MTSNNPSPRPPQNPFEINKVIAYEIQDESGTYITSYSACLSQNTNGKLDGLLIAKDALKCNRGYRIIEIYENGYRKLMDS